MVRLTAYGRYRGPFGPDPKKDRGTREQELLGLMGTRDGLDIIVALSKEAQGIPSGTTPADMIGMSVRHEMVPAILAHEYPKG